MVGFNDETIIPPLKKVQRQATEQDLEIEEKNKIREKEAFDICLEKIAQHGLDMKLIDAEITFDQIKLIFYFATFYPSCCFHNHLTALFQL